MNPIIHLHAYLAAPEYKSSPMGRACVQLAAETPAPAPAAPGFTPAAPGTLQRAPQLGEMFYSARGTPDSYHARPFWAHGQMQAVRCMADLKPQNHPSSTSVKGGLAYAGSPLGMFERDPSTQQGVLSTVLRGGQQLHSAVPAPSPAGANTLATIIKRPQPGARRLPTAACWQWYLQSRTLGQCLLLRFPADAVWKVLTANGIDLVCMQQMPHTAQPCPTTLLSKEAFP